MYACVWLCTCLCLCKYGTHIHSQKSCYSGFSPLVSQPHRVIVISEPLSQYQLAPWQDTLSTIFNDIRTGTAKLTVCCWPDLAIRIWICLPRTQSSCVPVPDALYIVLDRVELYDCSGHYTVVCASISIVYLSTYNVLVYQSVNINHPFCCELLNEEQPSILLPVIYLHIALIWALN